MDLKKLNLAEILAFSRVFTFPIVLIFIITGDRFLAAWLYILFFSTDFLDGFVAYFFNMESARRAKLDSLGDIFFLAVGIIGFYVFESAYFVSQISWIIIYTSFYVIELVVSLIKFGRPSNYHTYSAKASAFVFAVFLSVSMLWQPVDFLFWLTFFLGLVENIEETALNLILKKWRPNIKSVLAILKNHKPDNST